MSSFRPSTKGIEELRNFFFQKKIELHPCNSIDITNIEEKFNIVLPQAYKDFLLTMGRDAGAFMRGSSVFYPDILNLQTWANGLLKENGFTVLPLNSFVFWMHQGYQLAFFSLKEGENPPVYFFSEGRGQRDFVKIENSLSDFFVNQLKISGF